jgi:phosphohistidine swiveling domain-containing protein
MRGIMIDHTTRRTAPEIFEPPAPGQWDLETTHHGLRPLSPILRAAYRRAFEAGTVELVERYGLPLARVQAKFVHGCFYVRPLGVGERDGSTPKAPPPVLVMKVLARLHPALRRRAKTAALAWQERRWRQEVDQWFDRDRSEQVARNLALQGVELTDLDDSRLSEHVAEALAHFEDSARRNMATHGGDLMPVGDLLAHCEAWGIPASEVAGLLTGSSPATVETAELLRPVARAVLASGASAASIGSVDDIRALSADAREAVDSWLELHKWRTVTSDDVDRPTLAEVPALQLAALLCAVADLVVEAPDDAAVRNRVPPGQRELFDDLLVEARYGHRQREDIRGVCWNWPGGLVRRALLEVGRRLVDTGHVREVGHAVELFPDELDRLLRGGPGPSADELAERATRRDLVEAAPPPRMLGEPEAPPPIAALPSAIARATAAMMAILGADATPAEPGTHGMAPADTGQVGAAIGIGVGEGTYRGRACVVHDLMDAFDQLDLGDVLVAPFTGPSVNSLLPVLGALVVEEGGAMCHAAIVAREFCLPAVIGAHGATDRIPHGAQVEVDAHLGVVRLV